MADDVDAARTAAQLGEQWDDLRTAWARTTERITTAGEAAARERVAGEWSALETLRHLVFVHDAWFARGVRGAQGHHALGLPHAFLTPAEVPDIDGEADPKLADVLHVRHQQLDAVERYLDTATEEALAARAAFPPAWHEGPLTVRDCLTALATEEWHHLESCERDLDALGL